MGVTNENRHAILAWSAVTIFGTQAWNLVLSSPDFCPIENPRDKGKYMAHPCLE
jgi:hypothetical protein